MGEVYGYARVSTTDQNLARQLEQLKQFGIPERNIRCDKVSGKTFNRREYNALVGTSDTAPLLRKGDLLVIVSLDRLGRNYTEIKEQWNYIINDIGAQKELENTRRRQKQGLAVMPVINGKKTSLKTGNPIGRPNAEFPAGWSEYYEQWRVGTITAVKCMENLHLKRSTFYKMVKVYEAEICKGTAH